LDLTSSLPRATDVGEKSNEGDENSAGPTLLWKTILAEIPGSKYTHLAINEGIPLHAKDNGEGAGENGNENILRSPSGLRMLYGDFGPSTLVANVEANDCTAGSEAATDSQSKNVTEDDFARAFWVSTKQNGITQTWAPRWTMFSRGNIKEKARLLSFHDTQRAALSHRCIPAEQRTGAVAVDLYAGIGYFAFCYAALGFQVFCWELNPWSVEGLRRGAEANGWSVRVVLPSDERSEEEMLRCVLAGNETIVVFLEDNTRAASRIRTMDELTKQQREGGQAKDVGLRISDIMHVNCGLLPSSEGSWKTAWDIASETPQAWFHIHENVGVADIDMRKGEIGQWFAEREDTSGLKTELCVEHVELVKTFAPGVWHCVFDLYVKRCRD
jgi:tRNA wybutosine-synthesizing protein 2